jgi:hypothetical protein
MRIKSYKFFRPGWDLNLRSLTKREREREREKEEDEG